MKYVNLENTIKSLGFKESTKVQKKSYDAFVNNRSSLIISPTGTGKTHAYLIPLLEKIKINVFEIQAVIVVPTNELVMQVEEMLKGLNSKIIYKTLSARDDRKRIIEFFLKEQPQIVIATPGRLQDLAINENVVKVHTAKYLILDEADMLFDFDFMQQLNDVAKAIEGLVYVYSATMPANLHRWIRGYFNYVDIIDLSDKLKLNIDHYLIKAGMDKNYRLLQLLKAINPYLCLIFVSKNDDIIPIFNLLQNNNYNVTYLSSNLPIRQRKNILEDTKQLKYQYIVASDIMARGIDIEGISHIINYDMPYKTEFYIHRSGRTGRMKAHGEVYTFYENKDFKKFETLKKCNIDFKNVKIVNDQIVVEQPRRQKLTDEQILAIRKIKKPTKVKPGYRKKNKKRIQKALRDLKYKKGEKK